MHLLGQLFTYLVFPYAVLSGSSSTTPTPVSSEDSSAPTTTADTVKLLQSASAAANTGGSKKTEKEGGSEGQGAESTTSVAEGDEEDNIVTTIDEVRVHQFLISCILCGSVCPGWVYMYMPFFLSTPYVISYTLLARVLGFSDFTSKALFLCCGPGERRRVNVGRRREDARATPTDAHLSSTFHHHPLVHSCVVFWVSGPGQEEGRTQRGHHKAVHWQQTRILC